MRTSGPARALCRAVANCRPVLTIVGNASPAPVWKQRCKYAAFGKIRIACYTNNRRTALPYGRASHRAGAAGMTGCSRPIVSCWSRREYDAKQTRAGVTPTQPANQARVDCCVGCRSCAWGLWDFVAVAIAASVIFAVAGLTRTGQRAGGGQRSWPARAFPGRKKDYRQCPRSVAEGRGGSAVPMAEDSERAGWCGQLLRDGERQEPVSRL